VARLVESVGYNHPQSMASLFSFSPGQVRSFRKRLQGWYAREQRKLPWRGESDPYRILVSEVMLQQTRVAVVEERYKSFIRQFPSAEKLARARLQTVLACWSGLGYYRRARALHEAARRIAGNGGFPRSVQKLMELPGIGQYTAAAVASIAFDEPAAVVDGNVKRVLERLTGRDLSSQDHWRLAGELLEPRHPGDFNQAMMELGAVICMPGKPLCERCPVMPLCAGRGRELRAAKESRRKAVLRYALARRNGQVLLRQRTHDASLMAGMWELPECEVSEGKKPLMKLRHSITTTDYTVLVYPEEKNCPEGKWVPIERAERMALTGLTKKILSMVRKGMS